MKKIILGTALAMAFAIGMGDVEAVGKDNKTTITTLDAAYATPDLTASGCMGGFDELKRWAVNNDKTLVKPLQAVRDAFAAIADMKKLTGIGSIEKKITAATSQLPNIKAKATPANTPFRTQCREDINSICTLIRGRAKKGTGYAAIETFYEAVSNALQGR